MAYINKRQTFVKDTSHGNTAQCTVTVHDLPQCILQAATAWPPSDIQKHAIHPLGWASSALAPAVHSLWLPLMCSVHHCPPPHMCPSPSWHILQVAWQSCTLWNVGKTQLQASFIHLLHTMYSPHIHLNAILPSTVSLLYLTNIFHHFLLLHQCTYKYTTNDICHIKLWPCTSWHIPIVIFKTVSSPEQISQLDVYGQPITNAFNNMTWTIQSLMFIITECPHSPIRFFPHVYQHLQQMHQHSPVFAQHMTTAQDIAHHRSWRCQSN